MLYDDLQLLQQKIVLKDKLEAKLRQLQEQKYIYDREVISLRVALRQEQEDVQKLECGSLANYFYRVVGKLEGKLEKEREDAYAAKVKLDAAQRQLAEITEDIQNVKHQLGDIHIAQIRYEEMLEKKRAALKASGTDSADQILELEQQIARKEVQKKEIKEAIMAGYSARSTAEQILSQLDKADGWNTWDMISGGGILTHVAKHSYLDEAQYLVEELQGKLRRFQTELADVQISGDIQVNIDGFLRFADYFFDSLFTDWAVMDRINQSRDSVWNVVSQIKRVLKKLDKMESSINIEISKLGLQLDALVISA